MPEHDLRGRRALVTGGASGIGLACVHAFAGRGATVIVADFNADAAHEVADAVGGEAWVVDLSDTAAQEELALDVDILVNNAGIQTVAPIHEFDPDRWRFMHRLMVESPFLLIRAALPGMYDRGFGRVINISSVHGLRMAWPSALMSVSARKRSSTTRVASPPKHRCPARASTASACAESRPARPSSAR